jgi:hypothetical protein
MASASASVRAAAADAAYVDAAEALRHATAQLAAAARATLGGDDNDSAAAACLRPRAQQRLLAALSRAEGAVSALPPLLAAKRAAEAQQDAAEADAQARARRTFRAFVVKMSRRRTAGEGTPLTRARFVSPAPTPPHAHAHAHAPRAQAGRTCVLSATTTIDSLPDELLLRCFAPLPLLRRLAAAAACARFARLLHTPALRSALRRAHMLPQGESLFPGRALTSPDDRFRFIYQTDANVVLYYAPARHRGGHGAGPAVWALQTVGGEFMYSPGRLALLAPAADLTGGQLVAFDARGAARWASNETGAGDAEERFAPPFRLVVRDVGDVAILDAEDAEVWVAVPERRPWLDEDKEEEEEESSSDEDYA